MRLLRAFAMILACFLILAPETRAGDTDPLYVNLTTDSSHKAKMALVFSKNQFERKHPLTVFLNDRAVMLGSKVTAKKFKEHQELITSLVKQGATVLICPMCMKHYGVKPEDLMEGLKIGNPELTGAALFKDNTKTLTW